MPKYLASFKKGFSICVWKKTDAFSNGHFWTTRSHFVFGRFKGQARWPLTLLIFIYLFLLGLSFLFSSLFFFVGFFFVFLSWKEQHLTIQLQCFSLINPFFFFWFPVFFALSKPLSLKFVVSCNINVSLPKECKVKCTKFWSRTGVATWEFFFESPAFCKMWQVIIFGGGLFGAKFWFMFKKPSKKKDFFCISVCLPLFLLTFAPLSCKFSLVLCVFFCYLFSSCLIFLFFVCWVSLVLSSCVFLFLLRCCFMQRTTSATFHLKLPFFGFLVPVFSFLADPFSWSLRFCPPSKLCFFVQHQCFLSLKCKFKNKFGSRGGLLLNCDVPIVKGFLFVFVSSLLWFHENNNIKIVNLQCLFHQSFFGLCLIFCLFFLFGPFGGGGSFLFLLFDRKFSP